MLTEGPSEQCVQISAVLHLSFVLFLQGRAVKSCEISLLLLNNGSYWVRVKREQLS